MLITLLKKQFCAVLGGFGRNNKNKLRKRGVSGYIALIAFMTVVFGFMFFFVMSTLSGELVQRGLGWLYFVYAGLLATMLAVVGSVFMAQSQLYQANDNDFLLSLPIPTRYILFVRMVPLYVQNLLFTATVFIPAYIAYAMVSAVTAGQAVIWIVMLLVHPFLSLFLTCVLGFLLALITSRMRDKTLVTVILSILFLIAYMFVYTQFSDYVNTLIANSQSIGEGIKGYFYPLYKFGTALCGDFVGLVISLTITGVLFGGLYALLSVTYIKLVTGKRGTAKAKYKGKPEKSHSPAVALFKKEARRFFGSGMYFLNCGLGVIILVIGTLFFVAKGGELLATAAETEWLEKALPLIVCVVVSAISSMDAVSAPSVSLEGSNLWILQSCPLNMWQVIKAKLALHYVVTAPAATVCTAVLAVMIKPSWAMIILMLITPSVVVSLFGILGLIFNIKKPNLEWDNEITVIKQSTSALLTILVSYGMFLVMTIGYIILSIFIPAEIYLLACLVAMTALAVGLAFWLKNKGAEILANL